MRVWIDQDVCLGAGQCGETAPDVFSRRADGRYVVMESAAYFGTTRIFDGGNSENSGPCGAAGLARVPPHLEETVIRAVELCEAGAIYLAE